MVVLFAADQVESESADQLLDVFVRHAEALHGLEELLVRVGAGFEVGLVGRGREGLAGVLLAAGLLG